MAKPTTPRGSKAQSRIAPQTTPSDSARSLLFTLLGEFVFPADEPVWTASLLKGLMQLGVAEKAARQAISRASAAGWIEGVRDGRRVAWQLTPRMRTSMQEGLRRVHSIGQEPGPWDGRWLVLSISLPESHRAIRSKLYKALRWAGFGTPTPGLWINAHADRVKETRDILRRLEVNDRSYVFIGQHEETGLDLEQMVRAAWNQDETAATYRDLLDRFVHIKCRTDSEMFAVHFRLAHEWQQIPFIDPALPNELLFADFRARHAAQELEELRESLGVRARPFWQGIQAATPPK